MIFVFNHHSHFLGSFPSLFSSSELALSVQLLNKHQKRNHQGQRRDSLLHLIHHPSKLQPRAPGKRHYRKVTWCPTVLGSTLQRWWVSILPTWNSCEGLEQTVRDLSKPQGLCNLSPSLGFGCLCSKPAQMWCSCITLGLTAVGRAVQEKLRDAFMTKVSPALLESCI